ncbi:hypothetical protein SAMN04487977_101517 [Treponema bryantii]|uniref:Uncharacterized protein n=1 Tax=Treponema bryantii TaxID=163 RepID=A0A1H9AYF6_9SPIR|nr:hypothetical protein [Treponema bryantii]SEP81822.1 hypothetical protein SAMN04487977_101517 [Treponema bryantii]
MKDLPTWSDLNKGVRKMTDKEFDYCEEMEKRKHDEKVRELEAQIEKMKNWCNCKNYQQCLIELAEQGKGMKPSECCRNCKKWEIKEK